LRFTLCDALRQVNCQEVNWQEVDWQEVDWKDDNEWDDCGRMSAPYEAIANGGRPARPFPGCRAKVVFAPD
jgi:hypothetical protein